jgi:transposase-like protein
MAKQSNKKLQIQSKYNRHFSVEFKRKKVADLTKGLISIRDLCSMYEVTRASVYKWIYLYSGVERGCKTVVQMDSEQHKTSILLQRLAELERIIGQKQMEIDYLNKAFEFAKEEVGYDLKKKYEQLPSSGSVNTPKDTPTK